MKSARAFLIVLVTVPNRRVGRQLSRSILESKLAACVTLLPGALSLYWWQGRIDSAAECLLLVKTSRTALIPLERLILKHHPYDTPEILALPLTQGTPRYLAWLQASLH